VEELKRSGFGAREGAQTIRKVRVFTVAAEAAKGDVSRTPDMAQDTRDSIVDRLAYSSIGRPVSDQRHVLT